MRQHNIWRVCVCSIWRGSHLFHFRDKSAKSVQNDDIVTGFDYRNFL